MQIDKLPFRHGAGLKVWTSAGWRWVRWGAIDAGPWPPGAGIWAHNLRAGHHAEFEPRGVKVAASVVFMPQDDGSITQQTISSGFIQGVLLKRMNEYRIYILIILTSDGARARELPGKVRHNIKNGSCSHL